MKSCLVFLMLISLYSFSQRQDGVDFKKIDAHITPIFESNEIKGEAVYYFEILTKTDSIFLDAVDMTFEKVEMDGRKVKYSISDNRIGFNAPKKLGAYQLEIIYEAKPKQTVYFIRGKPFKKPKIISDLIRTDDIRFVGFDNPISQIWTQGQGKYTSQWLPSIDDMNDKVEFDLSIDADSGFAIIANGNLKSTDSMGYNTNRWHFDMTQPMSSYLAAFVIGNFDKKVLTSSSGIPIELYYEPKDSARVEPTYRYTKQMFDFLESEIGVAYPWQNYKQVPVQDFLYAGMENTTCTIFSNQYVIDSTAFVDKNYVNVNAHELAHQWFGNLVTEVSGEHHWLHEGFATYYAYLAEKELFGDEYFYWKLYDTAKTLHQLSENGDGEALTDPNAGSMTFYEKGAWALVMLRERVGDANFRKGIASYLNIYAYKNATISDFLAIMEKASGQNLSDFRVNWLESDVFDWSAVVHYLKSKNASIKDFLELQPENDEHESEVIAEWNEQASDEFKRHFIFRYGLKLSDSMVAKIINQEALKVRQAAALTLPKIPTPLQTEFESMLDDKSYVTQETILFKLWEAFSNKRSSYLNKLDGVVGLPNKNVRLLWLTLALVTPEYRPEKKKMFYDELNEYTSSIYNFEIRQLAFQYLAQIEALSNEALKNLVRASEHHVWQFKKSSRNLLRQLYDTSIGRQRIESIKLQLTQKEMEQIEKVLNP